MMINFTPSTLPFNFIPWLIHERHLVFISYICTLKKEGLDLSGAEQLEIRRRILKIQGEQGLAKLIRELDS